MNKDFLEALDALEQERNISKDEIIVAIESAIENAYKKIYRKSGEAYTPNVKATVDKNTGDVSVILSKEVVDEVVNEATEVSIDEASQYGYEVGDIMEYSIDPQDFGRIATQSAKQVVIQKVREAEREHTYEDNKGKKNNLISAKIERINNGTILLNAGSVEGILPRSEQVKSENLQVGDRIMAYVTDVKKDRKRGTQIFLSRSHPDFVRKLFEMEIPEISDGTIEIKGIAREAGSRTKIAVKTNDENVDPVGACVGTRGNRVQNIVDELFGEKIDIIVWDEDPAVLISNVLKPAVVEAVFINDEEKIATALVPENQLSLAIGREGQNVRLAARVSKWKIDIKSKAQLLDSGFNFDEYEDVDNKDEDADNNQSDLSSDEKIEVQYNQEII